MLRMDQGEGAAVQGQTDRQTIIHTKLLFRNYVFIPTGARPPLIKGIPKFLSQLLVKLVATEIL